MLGMANEMRGMKAVEMVSLDTTAAGPARMWGDARGSIIVTGDGIVLDTRGSCCEYTHEQVVGPKQLLRINAIGIATLEYVGGAKLVEAIYHDGQLQQAVSEVRLDAAGEAIDLRTAWWADELPQVSYRGWGKEGTLKWQFTDAGFNFRRGQLEVEITAGNSGVLVQAFIEKELQLTWWLGQQLWTSYSQMKGVAKNPAERFSEVREMVEACFPQFIVG